tara:strand:+ start:544 stop:1800 length:1257 start_codon:yes stop_codon:yes gene_type:complete
MAFFPIIAIFFSAFMARKLTNSWLSPGSFFAICWSFFLLFPVIFASDYKLDQIGLWFIVVFSMSLSSGSIVANSSNSLKSKFKRNFQIQINNINLIYFLAIFCLIIFFGLYLLLTYVSQKYNSLNYINNWMMIPNMIAIDRYAESINYPNIIKYTLYLIYPACLLGGLIFGEIKLTRKIKLLTLTPIFAAIILGVVEGARTSILLGLVLFSSAWLSTLINNDQNSESKTPYLKIIFSVGVFIILFTISFIMIQWLRQGMDIIVIEILINRIQAYFFGYLAAFTQWLGGSIESNFNAGLITFAGPFNLIGIMDRPLGFYSPINISDGISTNIFTVFRGIIIDFSVIGSILIAFLIGFITQIIFQNQKDLISTLPISMFYAFTLYSPLISIFHYNSILFSWLILFIILLVTKYEPLDSYS